jgi:hypothetical protein
MFMFGMPTTAIDSVIKSGLPALPRKCPFTSTSNTRSYVAVFRSIFALNRAGIFMPLPAAEDFNLSNSPMIQPPGPAPLL